MPQRQCDSSSLRFYRKEATINHSSHPDSRGPKKGTIILDIGVLPREETVRICMIVYPRQLHPLPLLSYDETVIRRTLHSRPRFRSDFYILRLGLDCARSSILYRVFHLVLVREYQDGTRGYSFLQTDKLTPQIDASLQGYEVGNDTVMENPIGILVFPSFTFVFFS